jgi:hypothetical protein
MVIGNVRRQKSEVRREMGNKGCVNNDLMKHIKELLKALIKSLERIT